MEDPGSVLRRTRVRLAIGFAISLIPLGIALDAWVRKGSHARSEELSANVVAAIMLAVAATCWYFSFRPHWIAARLVRPLDLHDGVLSDGAGASVRLSECTVAPMVKTSGGLWPMSEAVLFEDGESRILTAPSLLQASAREALRQAWMAAGREFVDFEAAAMQSSPVPRH